MTVTKNVGAWGSEWNRVADVVVIGSGAAASAAAASASRAGASVVILEKDEFPGGTTASSGGGMWIPNNFSLRARGIVDERDRCVQYMARSGFPALYRPEHPTLGLPQDRFDLLHAFFDNSSRVIDELQSDGIVRLDGYHFPDYYTDLPEAVDWGHSVVPRLPDDWKRGDPAGGALLATQLREAAEQRGATTLFQHRAVDVVKNVDGEVIGVEARYRNSTVLIGARKGVVFGTGGFLHNERMALDFLRGPVLGGAASTNATGDFVEIATRAGAVLGNMSQAWWIQVLVEQALAKRATSRDVFYVYGDSMIQVNKLGERVLNEKASYVDRGQAHFAWDSGRHEYSNRVLFLIFDEAVRQSDTRSDPGIRGSKMGRYPVPFPEESPSYLIRGDSWEDLADAIQGKLDSLTPQLGEINLDSKFTTNLQSTVSRFNEFAREGHDPDFNRGASLLEHAWASRTRTDAVNDSLYPLADSGPYYCVILGPGAFDTKGGPVTNVNAEVVDASGTPIRGLYGAGNCVSSPSGQAYWGPGCTIGIGLTFGYIAGEHSAAQESRSPELANA